MIAVPLLELKSQCFTHTHVYTYTSLLELKVLNVEIVPK